MNKLLCLHYSNVVLICRRILQTFNTALANRQSDEELVSFLQLQTYGVQKLEENFDMEGEGGVTMNLMVDAENLRFFEKDLELTSKGRASVSDVVSYLSTTTGGCIIPFTPCTTIGLDIVTNYCTHDIYCK